MNGPASERSGPTWQVRPDLIESGSYSDRYGQFGSLQRRRLPGCACSLPCLGYRCRAAGCPRTDLAPWCLGCADAYPNACDDCWARLEGVEPSGTSPRFGS